MEQKNANEYCQKHNLSFQVVYDDEIGFETVMRFKHFFIVWKVSFLLSSIMALIVFPYSVLLLDAKI